LRASGRVITDVRDLVVRPGRLRQAQESGVLKVGGEIVRCHSRWNRIVISSYSRVVYSSIRSGAPDHRSRDVKHVAPECCRIVMVSRVASVEKVRVISGVVLTRWRVVYRRDIEKPALITACGRSDVVLIGN